jgi:hypothetical protein
MWLKFQVLIRNAEKDTAIFGFQQVGPVPLYGVHCSTLAATLKACCYKHMA